MSIREGWRYWTYSVQENSIKELTKKQLTLMEDSLDDLYHDKEDVYCYGISLRVEYPDWTYIHHKVYFQLNDVQRIELKLDSSYFKDLSIKIQKLIFKPNYLAEADRVSQYVVLNGQVIFNSF